MRVLAAVLGQGVCPNLRELCLETVGLQDRDLLALLQVCICMCVCWSLWMGVGVDVGWWMDGWMYGRACTIQFETLALSV